MWHTNMRILENPRESRCFLKCANRMVQNCTTLWWQKTQKYWQLWKWFINSRLACKDLGIYLRSLSVVTTLLLQAASCWFQSPSVKHYKLVLSRFDWNMNIGLCCVLKWLQSNVKKETVVSSAPLALLHWRHSCKQHATVWRGLCEWKY
jgi:hypothetical protein